MDSYFILSYSDFSLDLTIGITSDWFQCHFNIFSKYAQHFLNTCLISGTTKHSCLIVYFSCPSHRISLFNKESQFLSLENDI